MSRIGSVICLASALIILTMACITEEKRFSGFARDTNLVPDELAETGESGPQKHHNIRYVRDEAPDFKVSEVKGSRYEAWIPATLDLADRAELAINALTSCVDPEYDYEAYETGIFYSPSVMKQIGKAMDLEGDEEKFILAPLLMHTYHGYNGVHPKYMESMAMLRMVGGSQTNLHVEQRMVEVLLQMMGNDGLYYMAIEGRPWALFDEWGSFIVQANPPKETAHLCALWPTGRALQALCVYAAREPDNALWREYLDRSMEGLSNLMVEIDDWGHFPGDLVFLDKDKERIRYAKSSYGGAGETSVDENTPVTKGLNAVSLATTILYGTSRYYKISGSETAGNLSRRLAKYLLYHADVFGENGSFSHHYHLNTSNLLALLEYATAFDDREAMGLIVQSYEFAKSLGVPLVGYWPESFPAPGKPIWEHMTNEGCAIGNMVALAVNLSQYGVADYWEDADRFIRNHLVEAQLTRADWIDGYARSIDPDTEILTAEKTESMFNIQDLVSTRNVAQRCLGIYSTWSSINDWIFFPGVAEKGMGWSGCCTGNGTRGIYYAWKGILDYRDGVFRVNLLMNRASEWADVNSHLPYVGRVDIDVKVNCDVQIRIPEWVEDIKSPMVVVNDQPRAYKVLGRYLDIGAVKAGDQVQLEFPMSQRVVELDVPFPKSNVPHVTLTMKGNEVIDIHPKGKNNPLYQRDHFRGNETLWKRARRFAPEGIDGPLNLL